MVQIGKMADISNSHSSQETEHKRQRNTEKLSRLAAGWPLVKLYRVS